MRQLLVLFVLVLVMQVVLHHGIAPSAAFDSLTLLTAGFILIGGYTMGELFRRMRLPALLGYLATGVLFGPKLVALLFGDSSLAPLGTAAIGELGLINVLAIGVIGTMGGGEIELPTLRENFAKIASICAVVFALVLPLIAGVVLALTFVAPSVVPFLAALPLTGRVAGALLFGALAVGMSPAATLALLQEVHARGRFTSLVLGVVVIGDLILVATFLLILALAKLLISPAGLSLASLGEQVPVIAAEFGWALALGVAVGLTFIAYLRFVGREVLLFSLAVVFVTAFVAARLHAETLLAFLVAGFTVQNFSRHGHTLIHAFERIALPVFVLYFTAQAAALDLVAVTVYLPLTLILVSLRVGAFVLGVGAGARWSGIDAVARRRLQVSFFSQGGVDLVLAAMVAEAIPSWGAEVQTVTMATVLFYVVGGPPLLARALDGAGESAASRERGAEQLAAGRGEAAPVAAQADPVLDLAVPRLGDPGLDRRLAQLHAALSRLRAEVIDDRIIARSRGRAAVIRGLAQTISAAFETPRDPTPGDPPPRDPTSGDPPSGDPTSGDPTPGDRPAHARARLDAAVAAACSGLDHAALSPLAAGQLTPLFEALDRAQDFNQSFRVARAATLFEPQGGRSRRGLRLLRRLRRAVAGPGQRTVPLGRLWRFEVALAVPVAIWRTTPPTEAKLWQALLEHHRQTRADLEALAGEDHQGLQEARARAQARAHAIDQALQRAEEAIDLGLPTSLAQAWARLLDAVEFTGTLELPTWRTRPSSRYDAAQAAIAELRERNDRDAEAALGRLDALLARVHAERVAAQIHDAAQEFEGRFAGMFAALDDDFTQLLAPAGPELDAAPLAALLRRMAGDVEGLRLQALHPPPTPGLRQALADVPEQLSPCDDLGPIGAADGDAAGDAAGDIDPRRTSVRLRAWLLQTLVQDFEAARGRADATLGLGLEALRQTLSHIARVVDYHAHPDHPSPDAGLRDAGLRERLTQLIAGAHAQLRALADRVRAELDETIRSAEAVGLEPVRGGRWDELRRRQRRGPSDGLGPRGRRAHWLHERRDAWSAELAALVRRVDDELRALSSGRHTPSEVASWRRALFGPRATMPEAYQRLFTSVQAEAVGLLIPRPELEALTAAAARWRRGEGGAILLHGDRGVGKRTLARQLIAAVGDDLSPHWLRLSPTLEGEAELAAALAAALALPGERPVDLPALQRRLTAAPDPAGFEVAAPDPAGFEVAAIEARPLIVLENSERLFRRSPEGLARVRRFLALVDATREQILWLVLIAEPAVPVLDAALELRARFATALHVPAMAATELAAVLDGRHRLSGYALRVVPGVPSLADWVRAPRAAWHLRRGRNAAAIAGLATLSGGNIRQALRLWLASARSDGGKGVVVGPFPMHACPLLDALPPSSRLLLAALMFHGPLRKRDLDPLRGPDALDLDAELTRLAHGGLIRVDPSEGGGDSTIAVDTRLVHPLTAELRACNLL